MTTEILVTIIASSGFWGVIQIIVLRRYQKKDKECAQDEKVEETLMAILHDRIFHLIPNLIEESREENEIERDEYKNAEYLFNAYSKLGGNGVAKKLFEQLSEMKIKTK